MKSTVLIFILLCLLGLSAFAQVETKKTEAYKFSEIGINRGSEAIKMAIEIIREDLKKNPKSLAIIFNYGKAKEKAIRVKEINRDIYFNDLSNSSISILDKGDYPFPLTEFWIVPEGAELPKPTSIAEKVDELGKTPDGDFKNRFYKLFSEISENSTLYIINTGTELDKKRRLLQINKASRQYSDFDGTRLLVIDGGYSKVLKTEFWILKK